MRIDVVLKHLCLVKSRSIAKSLCDKGRVLVNGSPVQPSSRVNPGDHITVNFARIGLTIELIDTPEKQLSKSRALTYYKRVEEEKLDRDPLDDL